MLDYDIQNPDAGTSTPICVKYYNSGGDLLQQYCATPTNQQDSAYYITNTWMQLYENSMIRVEAQGNDALILDRSVFEYCVPSSWNGSSCLGYNSVANGGDNQIGWCLSTDHTAAEASAFNGGAYLSKCCDGVYIILTGVGSAPSFSYAEYYGC